MTSYIYPMLYLNKLNQRNQAEVLRYVGFEFLIKQGFMAVN